LENFSGHKAGVDFIVDVEELPGNAIKYVGRPLFEDIDPKMRIIVITQPIPGERPDTEEEIIDHLHYMFTVKVMKLLGHLQKEGTLNDLLMVV